MLFFFQERFFVFYNSFVRSKVTCVDTETWLMFTEEIIFSRKFIYWIEYIFLRILPQMGGREMDLYLSIQAVN